MNLFICVYVYICVHCGISWWLGGKESACQYRRREFNLWSRKIPWRWKWPPTPVLLPWEIAWTERSLAGYGTWGHKRVRHNLATKQQQHVILDLNYKEGPSHGKFEGRTWGAFRESPKGVTLV